LGKYFSIGKELFIGFFLALIPMSIVQGFIFVIMFFVDFSNLQPNYDDEEYKLLESTMFFIYLGVLFYIL